MFSLTIVSPTYHVIDSTPKSIVATCGVMKRGCTTPRPAGIAPERAIDSVVRAVGRIVVCVDAAADVSTAMISRLSNVPPSTSVPRIASASSWSESFSVPAKAIAAVATRT